MSHIKKEMAMKMKLPTKKQNESIAKKTLGPKKGFIGTENMNEMGGNTGFKPKK